jgi:hypothetical protein
VLSFHEVPCFMVSVIFYGISIHINILPDHSTVIYFRVNSQAEYTFFPVLVFHVDWCRYQDSVLLLMFYAYSMCVS